MTVVISGRSTYRPLRHPGPRNRWTPEEIVAALHAWTNETGRPPRRADWTGERPGRAGAAQRKWMGEHPRWPSSSCVADHFGTWSAALERAALPARRLTYATTVAERVLTARGLAARGHGAAFIAGRLGVSPATVRNYIRAPDCPACGAPMPTPSADRCRECTRHDPTVARVWTRAEVAVAIRAWTAEHGAPPRYRDWTPGRGATWEAESPRWPSAAVVAALYRGRADPWNAALRDAGAVPCQRRWDDAAVRAALAAFWAQAGRPPAPADVVAPDWPGPSRELLRRRFGGVERAWARLGPVPV
jgi:Homing endonuclease associated repeat